MRRSARSINVCERTDGLWGLPPEVMCRVQRGKTWYSGSAGVYCRRTRVKMEILVKSLYAANLSAMPEDLEKEVDVQQMSDLLEYLKTVQ